MFDSQINKNMDVINYLKSELPKKRASHVNLQLKFLGLGPGKNVRENKKKIVQFYLDNYKLDTLEYYQMGKRVYNPQNKDGATTMVNQLFGIWDIKTSSNQLLPHHVTLPFYQLLSQYRTLTVV